jgi:hypothetical protein
LAAAAFLATVPSIFFTVPITVLFTGDPCVTVFLTTVVPELVSVDWLLLLTLPFPVLEDAAAGGALVPRPPVPIELAEEEAVTFRAAVVRVAFARSTMFVRILLAPPAKAGGCGFRGDTGLES